MDNSNLTTFTYHNRSQGVRKGKVRAENYIYKWCFREVSTGVDRDKIGLLAFV